MKKPLIVAACVAAVVSVTAQQRAPQNDSIRQEDLRADLFFLAGDSLRGRLTDTEENRAAADFIRSRFERLGLKGAGPGGSFFQPYNLMIATAGDPAINFLEITAADGVTRQLRLGQEFYPHRFSASGTATGSVVFAGFGISAPHLGYDDYHGDVTGKIVLALDHEPGERDPNSPFDGVVTSEPSTVWRKALAAQEKGAVAVLFVNDVHNHPGTANFEATARNYWPDKPPHLLSYTLAAWADRIHIPVAQISPALAASLVAVTGKTFEDVAKSAETPHGLAPVALAGTRLVLHTAVDRHLVPDRNVVALLEGSDPRLKNEWVIVSAHYDHNGADGTQIFSGADDNGSGVVAMFALLSNHVVEDSVFILPDANGHVNCSWGEHQLRTTDDFSPNSAFISFMFSGLNLHTAHHLFPNYCHHTHLPAITRIMRETVKEFGLQYRYRSITGGLKSHFRLLKKLRLKPDHVFEITR